MSYLFDEIYGDKDDAPEVEDKILLMGLQAAGKTAIKDVVFFDKMPEDMVDYMATVHYQRHFVDEEKKSLVIDSGGQESYWNEAVTHFRHLVFSNVKLLVWVVDVTKPELFEESERRFSFTIRQFKKENPDGCITVLCHKVDLVTPERMVVLHQHIRELFDDARFQIEFENTSIYYPESLKELVFTVMREAGINTQRFELISNLGEKIEESQEFQSFAMEHKEDPRIQQLRDFLNPEPQAVMPTFGKLDLQFDLSEYGIVEIVLIDKETYSPVIGASSQSDTLIQKSMEYLIGLHEIKSKLREVGDQIEPTGTVFSTTGDNVHGMIFNLASNYLLITSLSTITEERKEKLFELILKFAQTTEEVKKVEGPEEVVEPITVEEAPLVVEQESQLEVVQEAKVEEAPVEILEKPTEVITVQQEPEIQITEEPVVVSETALTPAEEEVEVQPELKDELAAGLSEILQQPSIPDEEVPQPETVTEMVEGKVEPEVTEELMQEVGSFVSGEIETEPEAIKAEPEPVLETASDVDEIRIDFNADDIKNFANFLMKTKTEVSNGIFSDAAIKSMSNFLSQATSQESETTEETGETEE
ncbi:MAG: ADP-ribosylation factor-like protein [Candidatus Thorarchaeota archaeon]